MVGKGIIRVQLDGGAVVRESTVDIVFEVECESPIEMERRSFRIERNDRELCALPRRLRSSALVPGRVLLPALGV